MEKRIRVEKANSPVDANIRRLLNETGLSQIGLAAALGITRQELWHMLNGVRMIYPCMIPTIAEYLGCDIDELFRPNKTA